MAEKPELQHVPRVDAALVLSEARSSLVARARQAAENILARGPGPVLRARVELNGKCGLIDASGTFVVEPFYCVIRDFSCGMAAFSDVPVQRSKRLYQRAIDDLGGRQDKPLEYPSGWGYHQAGHWGFVTDKWNITIPSRFKWVRDFSEDLSGVAYNDKWGFLSKDGSFAIEPQFEKVGDFSEGLCVAKLNGRYGFIERSGRFMGEPRFKYLWDFSEGLACAETEEGYCFLDRTGEVVIPPVFDSASDFHSGAAHAVLNGRRCLIDSKGSVIFTCAEEKEGECVFAKEEVGDFADDVALVSGRYYSRASDCGHDVQGCDGVCNDDPCTCPASKRICRECGWDIGYYIDRAGKPIPMPEGIVGIGDFSEGLGLVGYPRNMSPVGSTAYRYGYMDNTGEVKIAPQFHSAEDFDEGTARVFTEQGAWRQIDKLGDFVAAVESDGPDTCKDGDAIIKDGLARIEVDGLYGFADEAGNVVIQPQYSWVGHFSNGMARFSANGESAGKWGYIERTGRTVIPPQFDSAGDFELLAR